MKKFDPKIEPQKVVARTPPPRYPGSPSEWGGGTPVLKKIPEPVHDTHHHRHPQHHRDPLRVRLQHATVVPQLLRDPHRLPHPVLLPLRQRFPHPQPHRQPRSGTPCLGVAHTLLWGGSDDCPHGCPAVRCKTATPPPHGWVGLA